MLQQRTDSLARSGQTQRLLLAMPLQPRHGPTAGGDPPRGVPSLLLPSCRQQQQQQRSGCHHGNNKRRNDSNYRVLALAVGLLCCSSTTPHTASAFSLVPARAARSFAGSTAVESSAGRASVAGFSSRSAFAGLRVVNGCCYAGGSAAVARTTKLGNRNSRGATGGGVGGLSMGIPKLFRWLTDQYPVISQRLDQGLNEVSEKLATCS